ncbi:MAG: DNA-processing protein DprA [Syntrophorhabdales bacterium]|jgi:predicted Rossmann fold nucleotide-binding protein DprA/Smf involved in DNA uptake
MNKALSPNTQATLLLTAPLIAGRNEPSSDMLTPGEYRRLVQVLRERHQRPADLLAPDAQGLIEACQRLVERNRLKRLLARGFLLSQAIERWQTRAIWVASSDDDEYPKRLKARLKDDAPPIIYGCGDAAILDTGGLAVVGSRHVDDVLIAYTEDVGRLAAQARCTIVSGGARGVDQAAMRGALEAGGKVVGILADSLERTAMMREHRNFILDERLVLISPYDPLAGFNVGHAMQRNKLIYAEADLALVVNADYEKGGTWAGAVEQLERLRFVPVYARSKGATNRGLEALLRKGALRWTEPETPEALTELTMGEAGARKAASQTELPTLVSEVSEQVSEVPQTVDHVSELPPPPLVQPPLTPADELFAKVRQLLDRMRTPLTDAAVASALGVSKSQAAAWLHRLVKEGVLEKLTKPVRYRLKSQSSLFE